MTWGYQVEYYPVPAGLSNVVSVAAGLTQNVALKNDGTVTCWGSSATVPSGLSNVVAVASTYWSFAALKNDGTVVVTNQIKPVRCSRIKHV
jgi:hypothetical protein